MGGNYGGIVQAYALQRVIREMGYEVQTINSQREYEAARMIARRLRYLAQASMGRMNGRSPLNKAQIRKLQKLPLEFIDRKIETVDLFGMPRRKRHRLLLNTRAIIVGSDQVWRGGYANVLNQMLQFAVDYPLIKASYAASFGADRPIRFSRNTLRKSRRLAKEFSGVSVRESSGVRICRDIWGVNAEQHIDPSLLLTRADYLELASPAKGAGIGNEGRIFAYVLNQTPKTTLLIEEVASRLQLGVSDFFMDTRDQPVMAVSKRRTYPLMKSVEEWIQSFADADFVVTDSFHGTVFSIIFRVPFITIGNEARGMARFESLLGLLGLESRLVHMEAPELPTNLEELDWEPVEQKLYKERSRATRYLASVLEPRPEP